MVKKLLKGLLAVAGGLVALGVLLMVFREPLVRIVMNVALAGRDVSVVQFSGLELGTRHAALQALEVQLADASVLTLSGIAVSFDPALPPRLRTVTVALARLSSPPTEDTEVAVDLPAPDAQPLSTPMPPETGTLLLSDILAVLRNLPLDTLTLGELYIPQWPESIDMSLHHATGELALDVDTAALQLTAGFAQDAATAPARLRARLLHRDMPLGNLQLRLEPASDSFVVAGEAHLALDDLNALLGDLQRDTAALPVKGATLDLTLAGTVADDLRGTLDGTDANTFTIGIAQGASILLADDEVARLRAVRVETTGAAQVQVLTGASMAAGGTIPLQLSGSWRDEAVRANALLALESCPLEATTPCRFRFDGNAAWSDYGLRGTLALELPGLALGIGAYRISTTNLVVDGLPPLVPPFDIDANVAFSATTVRFATPLLLRDAPGSADIRVSGTHDIASGVTNARIVVPEIRFSESAPLSAWLGEWSYDGDVLAGSVDLTLDGTWQAAQAPGEEGRLTMQAQGTLGALGGRWDTLFFGGLSGALEAGVDTAAPYTITTPPLRLTLATLDTGVPLKDMRLALQMDGNTGLVTLDELSAGVFSGTVFAEDVAYDLGAGRNEFSVRFEGLQLADMLALVEYDAVEATGSISGVIPVSVDADGKVQVEGGSLAAREPGGTIRYGAAAAMGLGGNPGLDIASQVLSDFRYDTLTSSIDYTRDGELVLGMKLQGHNPGLGSDQPINLNLNLTDDIPALLESLRAARDIEAFLQEQYLR